MANEFTARNGLIAQKDSVVTGSLIVTSGITGSLSGTASYAAQALSSSYASAYAAVFPYIGNATITGSIPLSGSISINNGTDLMKISRNSGALGRLVFSRPGNEAVESVSFGGGNSEIYIRSGAGQILHDGIEFQLINSTGTKGLGLFASTGDVNLYGNSSTNALRVFGGTRNILIQNGGTFTDAGYRLDVQGTSRFNGNSIITGSINQGGTIVASSSSARGSYLKPILSASANNDYLVGVDIQPNYISGSYTNVTPVGLRVTNPGGGIITIGQNTNFSFVNEILCTGRLDFGSTTSQLFMRGTQIYFVGPTVLTRTGDASSTATQKSSYSFPMQSSLWTGTVQSLVNAGFTHKASTTVNLASRLAAIVNTTGTDLNTSGTEALTIFSPSANVLLAASGSTTFTDAGYRLDVVGTSRFNGNMNITGSLTQTTTTTAVGGLASSIYLNPTLSASANSDILGAIVIEPTFNNGGFTAVSPLGIYLKGGGQTPQQPGYAGLYLNPNSQTCQMTVENSSGNEGGFFTHPNGNMYFGTWSNNPLIFRTNNTNAGNISTAQNWTIGGTTDAGYKFDVQGTSRFNGNSEITGSLNITGSSILQGTPLTDATTLTGEQLSTGTGTNWSGSNFTSGYTHTVGSTTPLVATLGALNGAYYQLVYTISGRTAGSISINFGTYAITGLGNGTTTTSFRSSATTPAFTVTPTTDFDGIIVASVKYVTTVMPAISTYKTSTGVNTLEIRSNTAVQNTLIGVYSGQRTTTGTANTTLGFNAMPNNMTGTNNVAIGALTGIGNISGINNMFIGSSAGYSNVSGQNNCYIGISAGYSSTTASNNTFIGTSAGTLNLNGPNVGIGGSSLANNTTGAQNSAIGFQAMFQNTTGNFNDAHGREAGYANTTGGYNLFFGYSSGRYITDGTTANAITNNSIYIGHLTKALANNQTNQIVIGYNSTGLGSNTTVLGNSSTLTTAIYGNTLIGITTDAGYKFDVQGTSRFNGNSNITGSLTLTGAISTGGHGYFAQGVWANIYRNLFGVEVYRITQTTNNLLLGTTVDSGYRLNVSGSGGFSGNLTVTGSLTVTGGITGSLLGTASYATQALSASYAPPTFPYTGSATISGSLSVTGTTIAGFNPTPRTGSIRDGVTSVLGDLQDWNDKYYSGEVLYNEVAAETIAFGQLCWRDRYGKWSLALANVADTPAYNMLGICLYPSTVDNPTSILTRGYVETTYLAAGRSGDPLFIDATTAGSITETAPSTAGNVVRLIGNIFWANSVQTNGKWIVYFNPDNTWIEL